MSLRLAVTAAPSPAPAPSPSGTTGLCSPLRLHPGYNCSCVSPRNSSSSPASQSLPLPFPCRALQSAPQVPAPGRPCLRRACVLRHVCAGVPFTCESVGVTAAPSATRPCSARPCVSACVHAVGRPGSLLRLQGHVSLPSP